MLLILVGMVYVLNCFSSAAQPMELTVLSDRACTEWCPENQPVQCHRSPLDLVSLGHLQPTAFLSRSTSQCQAHTAQRQHQCPDPWTTYRPGLATLTAWTLLTPTQDPTVRHRVWAPLHFHSSREPRFHSPKCPLLAHWPRRVWEAPLRRLLPVVQGWPLSHKWHRFHPVQVWALRGTRFQHLEWDTRRHPDQVLPWNVIPYNEIGLCARCESLQ
jgi:hypothetical protein